MSKAMLLLGTMLDCGECDLEMLDRVGYSWEDVLEQMDWPDVSNLSFNGILRGVVDFGITEIKEALREKIDDLEFRQDRQGLSEEEKSELHDLRLLNPDVDIQANYNYRDTHVWFADNGAIYRAYLGDAVGLRGELQILPNGNLKRQSILALQGGIFLPCGAIFLLDTRSFPAGRPFSWKLTQREKKVGEA